MSCQRLQGARFALTELASGHVALEYIAGMARAGIRKEDIPAWAWEQARAGAEVVVTFPSGNATQ